SFELASNNPAKIQVTSSGAVYLDGTPAGSTNLEATLGPMLRSRRVKRALLEADKSVPYGRGAAVLDVMNRAGVAQPGTVAKPKPVSKKTAPPSPFGKSPKKPAEPIAQPQQPEVPVGGSGVTQLEGGDFPYSIYIERMKTLIGSHWFRPQVADSTAAIVYF